MRTALAVIAGALAAMIAVMAVEMLMAVLFKMPLMDDNDPSWAEKKRLMDIIPLGAKLMVLIGWAIGALMSGSIAALINRKGKMMSSVIVGLLFFVFTLINLILLPHPWWMWVMGLWMPVPLAYWGSKLIESKTMSSIIVGLLFFSTVLISLYMLPYPGWIWVIGLWITVPLAYWGSKLIKDKAVKE